MTGQRIGIFGATSAIAAACARLWAGEGNSLYLIGRNPDKLESLLAELRARAGGHQLIDGVAADLNEYAQHQALLAQAEDALGGLDVVLIAQGSLPDQKACESSVEATLAEITTNALSAISLLTLFLQGLRNRLAGTGVSVVTIKPGFVDTPMTAHIEKKGLLWAQPEDVARGILRAVAKRRDVVYLPGVWRLIMLVIRHIPEAVFKRLSL